MMSKGAQTLSQQQSKSKSVEVRLLQESEDINMDSVTNIRDSMKLISKFIKTYNPVVIPTPFQGTDMKMTSDGKYLVFGSMDGRLARLNVLTQTIDLDVAVDKNAILTLDFSPDNEFVYTSGQNDIIKKYSMKGFDYQTSFKGHTGDVFMIIALPDATGLISASQDKTVKFWDFYQKNQYKDLVKHDDEVQAIDLSSDSNYLMTGSTDLKAHILHRTGKGWDHLTTITDASPIFSVKISNKLNFVVTGNQVGTITSWKFHSWEPLKSFQDLNNIWCIEISENDEFIITGGLSNNINLWDMAKDREKITMKGHTKQIKSLVLTSDQKNIISLSNDSKIIKWKIPSFEDRNVISTNKPVADLWFSNQNGLLYVYCESTWEETAQGPSRELLAFNLINYSQVKQGDIQERQILFSCKSQDDLLYYVLFNKEDSQNIFISSYDLNTMERREIKDLGPISAECFRVSKDNKYLFIGQTFKIMTFLLQETDKDKEIYNSQIYHIGKVKHILCTENNKFILSADSLGIIKLLDVELMADTLVKNELEEITEFKGSAEYGDPMPIKDMKLIKDETLVAVSNDKILIWSIDKRSNIKLIQKSGCIKASFSLDGDYIFFSTSNRLEFWTTQDFSYNCFLKTDSYRDPYSQSFHITPDNKLLAFGQDKKIFISRSPISTQKLFICGDSESKFNYFRYISSIIDDSSENYEEGFDDWIIEPFHMNALHFYAFYNFDEHIAASIEKQAPFFMTRQGFSPLSISLEMDFPSCTSAILRKLKEIFEENPFVFVSIENCLTALNDSGYEKLHSLYELLMSKTRSTNLPKFCANQPSFPIVQISDDYLPKKETFDSVQFDEEGNSIVFLQTFVQLPIISGTSQSIEFIQSIESCRNLRIFDTKFIQTLLQIKWTQVRNVVYFQSIMYMSFLILLSLYTVEYRNQSFLIAPFAFNTFFLIYEGLYMISSGTKYFSDYWNFVDMIRIILIIVYTVLIWTEVYPDRDWFLAVVILISWTRGVAYFRSFRATRYLINLLITSVKDITAFLLILFYSTISFAIIFYSIDDKGTPFFDTLTGFYDLNIGNSNTGDYDKFHWLFYVVVTILNPIIMVNLLISILGDTYANVKEYEVVNDAKELISLISEAELLMFWNRGKTNKQYIHMCDDFVMPITQADDSIKNKIKALKRRVVKMTESMVSEEKLISGISNLLNTRNSAISDVIEKYEARKK